MKLLSLLKRIGLGLHKMLQKFVAIFTYLAVFSFIISVYSMCKSINNSKKIQEIIINSEKKITAELNSPDKDLYQYLINTYQPLYNEYFSNMGNYFSSQIIIDKKKNEMSNSSVDESLLKELGAAKNWGTDSYNDANKIIRKLNDSGSSLRMLFEEVNSDSISIKFESFFESFSKHHYYLLGYKNREKDLQKSQSNLNESHRKLLDAIKTVGLKKSDSFIQ